MMMCTLDVFCIAMMAFPCGFGTLKIMESRTLGYEVHDKRNEYFVSNMVRFVLSLFTSLSSTVGCVRLLTSRVTLVV